MPDYIFAYHGGKPPETPEAGAELLAKWHAWIGGLGAAMSNPGKPVGMSKTVSAGGIVADDGGSNPLAGFSLVTADSMDAALEMAKGCPHLVHGTVEVAEMIEI